MLPALAIVGGILGALTLLTIPMYLWLPDIAQAGDLARIIQAAVTATALVATGLFAAVKFQLFREFEPHLNITHEISCQEIGDSYVHIGVTAVFQHASHHLFFPFSAPFAHPFCQSSFQSLFQSFFQSLICGMVYSGLFISPVLFPCLLQDTKLLLPGKFL